MVWEVSALKSQKVPGWHQVSPSGEQGGKPWEMLCLFLAFVDALSAPMQHTSQAEKRARQMQDMGIDERDISDVPTTASKKLKAQKTDSVASPATGNANTPSTPTPQSQNKVIALGAQNATATAPLKKEKGE